MTIRHKAIKATLDAGLASEWNDDHMQNYLTRIERQLEMFGESLVVNWNLGQETSGTATIISLVAGVAAARLNATGGVGNISTIRLMLNGAAGNVTNRTELPCINMAVELGGLTNDNDTHLFGYVDSASVPFTPLEQGCYFRCDNGNLYAVTSGGAVETTTDLGAAPQYGSYRIEILSASVNFYVNGTSTPVATHTTNLPAGDLTLKFATAQRAGGSNTMAVQAAAFCVLRDT